MAHYIVIGDSPEEVPDEVRAEGRRAEWIIEQLLGRGLIAFDPRDLSVEELSEEVQDVDDRQVLGLLHDAEDRATALAAIEARADELED